LPKTGEFVVITKSMKDTMLLYELGVPACAPNSETVFLSDDRLSQLQKRFDRIVVFYDNDEAGIKAMNKIKKLHPELFFVMLPRYKSKDISDFYKKYGLIKTIDLIYDYKQWLMKQPLREKDPEHIHVIKEPLTKDKS